MRRRHTASLDAGGSTTCFELVEVGPVTPPDEIVKRLQLESGEQALIPMPLRYGSGGGSSDGDGLGGWLGRLGPVAVSALLDPKVGHLAFDDAGLAAQAPGGQ